MIVARFGLTDHEWRLFGVIVVAILVGAFLANRR